MRWEQTFAAQIYNGVHIASAAPPAYSPALEARWLVCSIRTSYHMARYFDYVANQQD